MIDRDEAAGRRAVLRAGMAAMAAGLAGAAAAVTAAGTARAQEKLAPEAVQYQTQPKDGQMCSSCVNFVAPNACNIVSGNIAPSGWCIAYGPKSS